MLRKIQLASVIFLLVCLSWIGCERQPSVVTLQNIKYEDWTSGRTNVQTVVEYGQLPANAVLVVAGNRVLTRERFDRELRCLRRAAYRNAESQQQVKEMFTKNARGLTEMLISNFICNSVYALEAEQMGVRPSSNDLVFAASALAGQAKIGGVSLGEYQMDRFGTIDEYQKFLQDQAAAKALFAVLFTNALEVTQKDVDDLYDELRRNNAISDATNALWAAELEELRTRLVEKPLPFSGDDEEDSKLLPEVYTVDHFDSVKGDSFEEDEIVPPMLSKMKPGEWSHVVTGETSLAIFQLKSIQPRNFQSPTLYTGTCIQREKDLGWRIPETNTVWKELRQIRNLEIVQPKSEQLMKKWGVSFPNGQVWRGWNESMLMKK